MSGSVCPGGSDIDMRPDDISRNVVVRDASAETVCDISRYVVIRGAPHIIGGGLVGSTQLNVDFGQYISSAMSMAKTRDLFAGLLKALAFGLLIGTISVAEGLGTTHGATGVGKATQRAVIVSFLAILISGYMITRVCYN